METLKILITVKTQPIPSAKYDELVCTAGVTAAGDFVRLYPIDFRDLPYGQQYKKWVWLFWNSPDLLYFQQVRPGHALRGGVFRGRMVA